MKPGTIAKVALRAMEVRFRGMFGLRLRPYKALLELTSSCNSRCTTCDIWKTPASVRNADIGLPEFEKFFESFGKDLVWLALSGGEVTLVDDFPELVALARRHCPNLRLVTFTTNGLLPERALHYGKLLLEKGFDPFVTVSLDGDEETHDRIRGVPGNHRLALRTLQLLKEAGIPAHFGLTIGDGNRELIREHRMPMHHVKAVTFVESGGIYRKTNRVDDRGISQSIATILASYRVRSPGELIEWIYLRLASVFFRDMRKSLPIPCDVLRTSVHVTPGGDVRPCMFLPSLGNIKAKGFREIRDSQASTEALKRIDSADCPRCWMNCYAPHSIMSRPLSSFLKAVRA